jgi:hypothetical protein
MLATNSAFYGRVLNLEIPRLQESGLADWKKFFDSSSSYRLLYTLQIVQAILEDGNTGAARASVVNADAFPTSKVSRAARS